METSHPVVFMTKDEIKTAAADVAAAMKSAGDPVTPELRDRFIAVRGALYQRGVFDPVLVRFDSATVAKITSAEAAEQLEAVAASLC